MIEGYALNLDNEFNVSEACSYLSFERVVVIYRTIPDADLPMTLKIHSNFNLP